MGCGGSSKKESKSSKSNTKEGVQVSASQFVLDQKGKLKDFYKVGAVLGTGAFGEVRACVHKQSGAQRAVKCILKDFINEDDKVRFFSEIEVLRKMDHPNIVKMYELFHDERRYYLVTEMYTGGELFDKIIDSKYFSEKEAAKVMKQLLSAVLYCHNKSIVHRDLKPENLVLETKKADAAIKVIDFGTSEVFNPSKKMKQKYGTPYYIAPEVIKRNYTEKCDVWSAGVIMYILLCGYPPFNGYNDDEIMEAVEVGKFSLEDEIWLNVTSDAKDLVKKMLTRDPTKRFTAEQALGHKWIIETAPKLEVDQNVAGQVFSNIRKFKAERKLEQATLTYIVSNLISNEEKKEMKKVFEYMDKNGDGRLSREELIDGYTNLYGATDVEEEVDRIMSNVDIDQNGYIDYSEFALATLSNKKLVSKEKMQAAFRLFDKDGSGSIEADEIKAVLGVGQKFSDDVWKEIVKEVDENEDGKISYEEFEKMMYKFISANSNE